jgi:hypothetical protein
MNAVVSSVLVILTRIVRGPYLYVNLISGVSVLYKEDVDNLVHLISMSQ